jgi:hypothetical protein
VREFDAQGWHRTGSRVDNESADWLVEQLGELGFRARLDEFEIDRVIPDESYLEIDGERVEGFPLFDGSFTGDAGVSGVLGFGGDECDVALVEFPAAGAAEDVQRWRHSGGYVALIGVVEGEGALLRASSDDLVARRILPPSNSLPLWEGGQLSRRPALNSGIAIRNAEYFLSRGGAPVLQVSGAEYGRLKVAAERGELVRVVVRGEVEDSSAQNVVVVVPGVDRELDPLVVMTPRSGWFNCAIERGGGIACWLEMMLSFRDSQPGRDVIFVATSGHELGHAGLEAFLELYPELPRRAIAWIHLGASIGAARGWTPRLQTSDAELEFLTLQCFVGTEFERLPRLEAVPQGTAPGGEALQIHRKKGRYVSIVGGHDWFHLEEDRWPEAVDVDGLVAYAGALVRVAGVLGH